MRFGSPFDEQTIEAIFRDSAGYAETLLQYLGAKDVHSFDFSNYEGATHVHDMNLTSSGLFQRGLLLGVRWWLIGACLQFPSGNK